MASGRGTRNGSHGACKAAGATHLRCVSQAGQLLLIGSPALMNMYDFEFQAAHKGMVLGMR